MDIRIEKSRNIITAIAFLAGTAICTGYAGMNFYNQASASEAAEQEERNLEQRSALSCERSFGGLPGVEITTERNKLFAEKSDPTQDPYFDLALITSAMQSCPGYRLESFCMGAQCESPVEATLVRSW